MAVASQLLLLEKLDSDLESLEAQLASAQRRIARNEEVEAAETRLDTARREEEGLAARQRSLESDLGELERKITRDQNRIYGGQIVDPREIASLQRELEHYGHQRSEIEDQLLEVMERRENLQDDLLTLSRRANELRERWEDDRRTLTLQVEGLTDTLAGMRAERETMAAGIDPAAVRQYALLRKSAGHAVSTVANGVCQWCRVTLPPRDVQHARAGALVLCTNCARILYVA